MKVIRFMHSMFLSAINWVFIVKFLTQEITCKYFIHYRCLSENYNMCYLRCKDAVYPEDLPAASIIICFYNEHLPTLLRTIHSILDRTPSHYLEEIILIDDYSDLNDLHSNLTKYINKNKEVKRRVTLLKTERREGLIRARMFGARKTTGEVLIFLDSHVEVNVDWIQPLLARIKENRTNVAIPVIDIINADTFTYTSSPLVRGGFNWGLHFKWENLPTGISKVIFKLQI